MIDKNNRNYLKIVFVNCILILLTPFLILLPIYFLYEIGSFIDKDNVNARYAFIYLYLIYLGFGAFPLGIYGFIMNSKFREKNGGNIRSQIVLIISVGLAISTVLYLCGYFKIFPGIRLDGFWFQSFMFISAYLLYGYLLHRFIKPLYNIGR